MSTQVKVLQLLEQVLETPQVGQDLSLRLFDNHLIDSLQTVELMVAISDTFGFDISPAEFEPDEWATPQHIVDFVVQRVGHD